METNTTVPPVTQVDPTETTTLLSNADTGVTPTPSSDDVAPVTTPVASIQPSTFDMNTVINPDGTFKNEKWYGEIDADLGESKTLGRFKNIQTVIKSLDHAESLVSKKVIQPKDMDESTAQQFYQELGVPKTTEEYGFTAPEGLPEGQYDDSTDKWFAQKALESNIPKDVANNLRDAFAERQAQAISLNRQKSVEADAKYLVDNENALNLKFPNKVPEVLAGAKRFLDAFGMTDSIEGTKLASNAEFLEQMYNNSLAMGEDKLVDAGQSTGNSDTGSEMQAKMLKITENPAYTDLKHSDHARLVREFEALMSKMHQ